MHYAPDLKSFLGCIRSNTECNFPNIFSWVCRHYFLMLATSNRFKHHEKHIKHFVINKIKSLLSKFAVFCPEYVLVQALLQALLHLRHTETNGWILRRVIKLELLTSGNIFQFQRKEIYGQETIINAQKREGDKMRKHQDEAKNIAIKNVSI